MAKIAPNSSPSLDPYPWISYLAIGYPSIDRLSNCCWASWRSRMVFANTNDELIDDRKPIPKKARCQGLAGKNAIPTPVQPTAKAQANHTCTIQA